MEEKKIVETLFVRRSVNVSEQDIDDILCTAFEGGITYWCDSVVFMGKEVDGLGEDPFRIRDTRTGRNNGRIYPYYDDAVYRIDGREGE